MDNYELDKASRPTADFIDDLSTWYIRRSRSRFKEEDEDKNNAINTTHFVLLEFSKIIAPFMPFAAEEIYRELSREKESVHLDDWPESGKLNVDDRKLIDDMQEVRKVVSVGMELRLKEGIKVRQPLNFIVVPEKLKPYAFLIKDELNVRNVVFGKDVSLNTEITPELKQEGILRELSRNIQNLRKKSGLKPQDKISLFVETSAEGEEIIKKFKSEIKKGTNTASIEFLENNGEELKIDELKFKIEIKK